MNVSFNEIKDVFNNLIEEKQSREEIAIWASLRQVENDVDNLEFEPSAERKRIWAGITYLMGVDLKDLDGSYLHSIDNFIEFRERFNF